MARATDWTQPTLADCIRKCLVVQGPKPVQTDAARETILARRKEQQLTGPPAISGFTAENIVRCSEHYTHAELVEIAVANGIRTKGSHLGLCGRLLLAGLLDPNKE